MGVITGVQSMVTSRIMDPKYASCIPNSYLGGQLLSVVVLYMRNHPDQLHHDFTTNVLQAFIDRGWRCSK